MMRWLAVVVATGCGGSHPKMIDASVATDGTPPDGAAAGGFAYVVNESDATVSQYAIGPDGGLTAFGTPAATGAGPYAIAIDRMARYAYVADHDDNTVAMFAIGADGSLSAIAAPVAGGEEPYSLAVDAAGAHLYVADYGTGLQDATVSTFAIGGNGGLTTLGTALGVGAVASSIVIDRSGAYGYVTNFYDGGSITELAIGGGGTPSLDGTFTEQTGVTPYVAVADPVAGFVYVANDNSNTVSQLAVTSTGGLTPVTADVAAGTTPGAIAIDASGKHLFVANRGSNDVWSYTIAASGSLTKVDTSVAIDSPAALAVDATGQYLYVVGYSTVVQLAIAADGGLSKVASVPTGNGPRAITIARR